MPRRSEPFSDDRWDAWCAYCDDRPGTRDHVPPKVFLSQPYPENLATVDACESCNRDTSQEEEYVAVLLEAARSESTNPAEIVRPNLARALRRNPLLRQRVEHALRHSWTLTLGDAAVEGVLAKIARGLWRWEMGEARPDGPAAVTYSDARLMSDDELRVFAALDPFEIMPEVGSRMFQHAFQQGFTNSWERLQPQSFEYALEPGGRVKMLLRGVLAASVALPRSGGADVPWT